MKVRLTMDEGNNICIVGDSEYGREVDVPENLLLRFQRLDKEFRKTEDELYKLYKKAGGY